MLENYLELEFGKIEAGSYVRSYCLAWVLSWKIDMTVLSILLPQLEQLPR
jgi:hypothetical protein